MPTTSLRVITELLSTEGTKDTTTGEEYSFETLSTTLERRGTSQSV